MFRILIISLLLIFHSLKGSSWEFITKHFEPTAIPAQHLIWSMQQDQSGRMWLASNDGLLRYDGTRWVLYPTPNPVRSFVIGPQGKLFVACEGDIGILSPDANTGSRYQSLKNLMGEAAQATKGEKTVLRANDQVYYTSGRYVMKVAVSGESYQLSLISAGDITGAFTANGKVYINTIQQGLLKLEGPSFKNCTAGELLKNKILTGNAFMGNQLLLSTNYDGIYQLDNHGLSKLNLGISMNGIASVAVSGDWVAVGYFSNGVVMVNPKTGEQKKIPLPSEEVYSMYADSDGNIWVGHRKGVSVVYTGLAQRFYPQCATQGTITDLVDIGNELLLSSYSGLDVITKATMSMKPVSGFSGEGLQLLRSGDDVLIAGTSGLFVYKNGKADLLMGDQPFVHLQKGNRTENMYAFASEGCFVVSPQGNSYSVRPLASFNELANSVYEEADGSLWVGTYYNGLKQYSGILKPVASLPEALQSGKVEIHVMDNAPVFKCADKVYTLSGSTVSLNEEATALLGASVRVPFECNENCWVINRNQVAVRRGKQLDVQTGVNEIPGRISMVITSGPVSYVVCENRIYSCPVEMRKRIQRHCQINRIIGSNGKVLNDVFTDSVLKEIDIPFSDNQLEIEAGINAFVSPEKNRFRYLISGIRNWSEWQEGGAIRLAGLSPGTYEIQIEGSDAAGELALPAGITFRIHPPWYRTIYAYLIYLSALMMLVYLVVYLNNRRLIRQNRILEKEVKARTSELENSNMELRHEKKKSDDLLLNILPLEVANELKQTGFSKAKQYDQVTVLFTDFVNFTGISEKLSPEELVQEIHKNFTAFDAIMEKHGLEKIKTIGDAYLAVCGMPIEVPDHAHRVIRAALEIRNLTQNGGGRFQIRIGVNSGPVIAGIVGVKKYAYDIWGDTVNMAARMEQHSEAGKINISGATYQLIKEQFQCEYRGKINAKNKGEVDMYFVRG